MWAGESSGVELVYNSLILVTRAFPPNQWNGGVSLEEKYDQNRAENWSKDSLASDQPARVHPDLFEIIGGN